jgi:hypothetical protein
MPIEVLRIENDEGNMVILNVGDTSRREEGCDGCLAGVTDEGEVGTERMEDCMSGSGLEAAVERSEVCDGIVAMHQQVELGKNIVDEGNEKDVVECNVRIVEVSNDICLGNEFQEEADQENKVKDQAKKGTDMPTI